MKVIHIVHLIAVLGLSGCAANPPEFFSPPLTSQWTGSNGDYLVRVNGTGLTVGQINGREVQYITP